MAKWADYLISEVRYNEERQHIDQVKVREYDEKENSVSGSVVWTREKIISKINAGSKVFTIYRNESGSFKRGDKIEVIEVKGIEYIKTVGDEIEEDNLGELPEF